jgi:hypothetical protein
MTRLPLLMLITLIKTFASKTLGALRQDPRLMPVRQGRSGPKLEAAVRRRHRPGQVAGGWPTCTRGAMSGVHHPYYDIKAENILLDEELGVKLADLGMAKLVGHDLSCVC